jgi:hypothetical protein
MEYNPERINVSTVAVNVSRACFSFAVNSSRKTDKCESAVFQTRFATAKGRVERANQTLQDRLIKEVRLEGISSIEAANTWLDTFIAGFNRRFARPVKYPKDLHRPWLKETKRWMISLPSRNYVSCLKL